MVANTASKKDLQAEIERLRRRVAELEGAAGKSSVPLSVRLSLFDSAPFGIAICDANHVILDANPALRRILGCNKTKVVGRNLHDYWYAGFEAGGEARTADLIAGIIPHSHYERILQRSDGKAIHVMVTVRIERDPESDIPYVIKQIEDITEQRQREEEQRTLEGQYQGVVESLSEGICIFRGENRLFVNQRFVEIFGYASREAAMAETVTDGLREQEARRLAYDDVFPLTHPRLLTTVLRSDGTEVDVEISFARTIYGGLPAWTAVVLDITELRRSAQQRQELLWRIAESKEEQSQLIARELHDDIGQLLTGLKLQLEAGAAAGSEDGTQTTRAEAVRQALETTRTITDRVSGLSLALWPSVLDQLGLMPALRSMVDGPIKSGVSVQLTPRRLPRMAPPIELAAFRIVQEALTNVVKYAGVDEASVALSITGQDLLVAIEDKGHGTTRRLNLRSGDPPSLGLSSMRERAEAVGGTLSFESTPGQGTKVIARLPIGDPSVG